MLSTLCSTLSELGYDMLSLEDARFMNRFVQSL